MKVGVPFLKFYIRWRLKKGKEDPTRVHERFGYPSCSKPEGDIIWLHGASVGESASMLPLIHHFLKEFPYLHILVTTGTVTSARFLEKNLPLKCLHHFIPLDTPQWIDRFLDHWRPNLALFVESELWPNLLLGVKSRHIPLLLLNARLSEKSFTRWQRIPKTAGKLFSAFNECLTPTPQTATYLRQLGARKVRMSCHMKFAVAPLSFSQEEGELFTNQFKNRLVWAATSTHEGEEDLILQTHIDLKKRFPNLLTFLVPRHPHRCEGVLKNINAKNLYAVKRSEGTLPCDETDIWLIDTIGDLGLIYHLVPIAFIGGSFVPIGGHNPIEALALGSAVIIGPHAHNFSQVIELLNPSLIQVKSQKDLGAWVTKILSTPEEGKKYVQKGQTIIDDQRQAFPSLVQDITSYLKK